MNETFIYSFLLPPCLYYYELHKFGSSKSRKYLNLFNSILTLKCVFLKISEPENIEGIDQEMVSSEAIIRAGNHWLSLCLKQIIHLPGGASLSIIWKEDGNAWFTLFLKGTQSKQSVRWLHYCMLFWPCSWMTCSFLFLILFIG